MKWDAPTVLLILMMAGMGAYVLFKPEDKSKANAELLKQVAKLVAALAALKGTMGKMKKIQDQLTRKLEELHGVRLEGPQY